MIKRFKFLITQLLFLIALQCHPQSITMSNDTTICLGDSASLSATVVSGSYGTTSYTFQTYAYSPEPFSGGTPVCNSFVNCSATSGGKDDCVAGPFPIGFDFCFFSQTYTQFWIGSNGWISFSQPPGTQWDTYTATTIPNSDPSVPKNVIFFPWEDWLPCKGMSQNVYYYNDGTAPNMKLVVYFTSTTFYNCNGTLWASFEVVLNQQTSVIENHIQSKPLCGSQGATQGVQDSTGTIAFTATGRNDTPWSASNESTRFVPGGITWYTGGYPGGTVVGYGNPIKFAPTVTTTYTAAVQLCDQTTLTGNVTVTVISPQFNYPQPSYCQNAPNPIPNVVSSGGTFTASPAGLVFVNASTGVINLGASIPGPYVITYTLTSPCALSSTQSLTIIAIPAPPTPLASYVSRCGPGQVTFGVVQPAGETINWYDAPVGGNLLPFIGATVTTNVSSTTNYYAEAVTNISGCTSLTRTDILVVIKPIPVITNNVLNYTICSGDSIKINLTSSIAPSTFQWTASSSSGTLTGYSNGSGSNISQKLLNSGSVNDTVIYSVVATADTCNSDTTKFIVAVNPLPIPTVVPLTQTVCSNNLIAIDLSSSSPAPTFSWIATGNNPGLSGFLNGTGNLISQTLANSSPSDGTVTYNIVAQSLGCTSDTVSSTVLVHPLPIPIIDGSPAICVGSSGVVYSTQPGMSNYQWSISAGGMITAGGTATDNTVTATWNTSGPQTVSVNYNDANNCTASAPVSYPVTVNTLPSPTIAGPVAICAGIPGSVYSTQPGMTNYQWLVSGGGTITAGGTMTDNSVTVTWNTAGVQTVSINYNDANNCTAGSPFIYNVTVNPLPNPTITGSGVVCSGTSGVIYTTQPGMSNYTWAVSAGGTITSGGSSTDQTVTITWNTPGAQSVSINYNDPNGCTAVSAFVLPVTINTLPVPTISGNNNLCAGTTGVVYSTQAGMTNYLWLVSAGGAVSSGGTATDNTVTVTWNTAGAQTVSVNYHDANNCTANAPVSYPVTVNPLPSPTIAGPLAVCAGIPGSVYSTQPGMTNYQWVVSAGGTITAGGTINDNSITITWNTAGAQSVTVNYHDSNGCTALAPVVYNVTVNPLPVPAIAGPGSACLNSTTTYSTAAGMNNYTWTVTPGGSITSGSGTNTITVLWSSTGLNTITLNYDDANGCTAVNATSYNVTVIVLPVPSLSGSNQICVGSSATYTTDAGMMNYSWTISAGGSITSGGGANNNTVTILWSGTGLQTVSVNYVAGTGCTAPVPTILNVTVNPLPTPIISGTSILCVGTSGVVYSTQPGMTNYQWTVSAGGTITAGGSLTDHTVTVTWNTAGVQSVSVNFQDMNNCTALIPVSYPVTVNPLPVPSISGPAAVCLNSTSVYFTDAGMTNYIWSVSPGGSITSGSGTSSITVLWSTTGAKTITVNYSNANNCTAVIPSSYNVNVSNLPVPSLNGINVVCNGSSVIYSTDAGMTGYSWSVTGGGTITSGGGPSDNTATILWNIPGVQSVSINYQVGPGCTAPSPTVLSVTVKPLPLITNAANSSVCSGTTLSITPQANLPGTTFSWTATGSSGNVTGYNSGSGVIIADHLINTGFNIETVTYAVLPTLNGCNGSIADYIVTVYPVADVMFTPNGQTLCSGVTTGIALSSHVAGTTFSWTATGSSGNITGFGVGSGNTISQTLTNSGFAVETATYSVIPTANGCPGASNNVVITVNPLPVVVYTPCTDITTTTDAVPFALKGGTPLGGLYSSTGVNAGIFYPSLAGTGTITVLYSYINNYGSTNNASLNISVLGAPGFICNNVMTDVRDNLQYPTVQLGTQCWLAANLNFGNTIPSSSMQRDNCVVEKYCFNDNAVNCSSFGGLYQWDEMMQFSDVEGIQGLCPPAWHIPTENEWTTLFNFYTSNGFAGSPLKSTGFSGFNALLMGIRFDNGMWNFFNFATFFWSSTSDGLTKAWAHAMNSYVPSVSFYPGNRSNAFSVRCLKN